MHIIALKVNSPNAIQPVKASPFSACVDLAIEQDYVIMPNETVVMDTGIAMAIPKNFMGVINGRSGWAIKGLRIHQGIIDSDYRGNINIIAYSGTKNPIELRRGDRVAQFSLRQVHEMAFEIVDHLPETLRGEKGFGSSGTTQSDLEECGMFDHRANRTVGRTKKCDKAYRKSSKNTYKQWAAQKKKVQMEADTSKSVMAAMLEEYNRKVEQKLSESPTLAELERRAEELYQRLGQNLKNVRRSRRKEVPESILPDIVSDGSTSEPSMDSQIDRLPVQIERVEAESEPESGDVIIVHDSSLPDQKLEGWTMSLEEYLKGLDDE